MRAPGLHLQLYIDKIFGYLPGSAAIPRKSFLHMKRIVFLATFLTLISFKPLAAQELKLSPIARISVLTCGPGTELYSTFGHTAFRIQDPINDIDWVYNYGTFDFDTPNFYMKFARGKLQYALTRQRFTDFLYTYQLESRWVREQWLDLDPSQKASIFEFLQQNLRPENRFYQYDFLFENCATKIPEVLHESLSPALVFSSDHLTESHTFRDLIQQNLDWNSWSSFGIDLALGAVIDREAHPEEYQFLPDYVRLQIQNAQLGQKPLMERERSILDLAPPKSVVYFTATPLFWALVLLVLTAAITWIDLRNQSRSRVLDFLLFFLTGIAGVVVFFLWFLTDHSSTAWNGNILWAFPTNAVLAMILVRKREPPAWLTRYLWGLLIFLGICLVLWVVGLQNFAPILLVVWAALLMRYLFLITYFKRLG